MTIYLRLIVAVTACVVTAACATTDTAAQRQQHKAAQTAEFKRLTDPYQTFSAPQNYRAQVDEYLVSVLKDPDSRKVEYAVNKGAIVCGSVNAKNSYGGYTGAQPFGAVFERDGTMKMIYIFDTYLGNGYIVPDMYEPLAYACGVPLTWVD